MSTYPTPSEQAVALAAQSLLNERKSLARQGNVLREWDERSAAAYDRDAEALAEVHDWLLDRWQAESRALREQTGAVA